MCLVYLNVSFPEWTFQVRFYVKSKVPGGGGSAWSDFKKSGGGSGTDAYVNADSQVASSIGVTAARWTNFDFSGLI